MLKVFKVNIGNSNIQTANLHVKQYDSFSMFKTRSVLFKDFAANSQKTEQNRTKACQSSQLSVLNPLKLIGFFLSTDSRGLSFESGFYLFHNLILLQRVLLTVVGDWKKKKSVEKNPDEKLKRKAPRFSFILA